METPEQTGAGGRRAFRKQLQVELEGWQREGLVTEEQGGALRERYRLDALEGEGTNLLLFTIYAVGAVLIAGGVISFVAAHWDEIPRVLKIVMLLTAMLGSHGVGYWLWKVDGSRGSALVNGYDATVAPVEGRTEGE